MSVAPFGYRFDAEQRLEVVPAEAAILLELYSERARGASYGKLVELLVERTGRRVERTTMAYMLRNRTYLGELRHGEAVNTDGVEAIVPLELFETVQAVNRARSGGRGAAVGRAKSLLAGIARCRNCGRGLICSATGSRLVETGERPRSYKCPASKDECAERAHIQAEMLEDYVLEQVIEWVGRAADELVEVEVEVGDDAERLVIEQKLRQAERALAEHEADVELELEIGGEAYKAGRKARVELVERRRRELERLGEASELELARTTLRQALVEGELEVDERRRLLGVVLEAVLVRRTPRRTAPASERVEVVFRTPLAEDGAEFRE